MPIGRPASVYLTAGPFAEWSLPGVRCSGAFSGAFPLRGRRETHRQRTGARRAPATGKPGSHESATEALSSTIFDPSELIDE